jgi:hypothetical protein
MFRVHLGYTVSGRDKWKVFPTLEAASAFCQRVFQDTGLVLSITRES